MTTAVARQNHDGSIYCHHPTRQETSKELCTQRAGWGTAHPGTGFCKLHGGCAGTGKTLTHGLTSRYIHQQLQADIDKYEADPDPLNLLPELAFLRACLQRYLALHPELTDTELVPTSDTQAVILDKFAAVGKIVDRIANVVSKIEAIRASNAISLGDLSRMITYFAEVVQDHITDEAALVDIRQRWRAFRWESGAGQKGKR